MSERYDKMKQIRLLPETLRLLERFQSKTLFKLSIPKISNIILQDYLKERVK